MISNKIELMNIIGRGTYGDVYMGRNIITNEYYAVKKISKKQLESQIIYQYFNNEIFLLKQVDHPNIIKFKSLDEYKSDYYLSTQYCNGGSLERAMKSNIMINNKPLSEKIVRYFVYNVLKGITYLNQKNIIHRDIKSDNILLHYDDENDLVSNNYLKAKVLIIDFGFARYLQQDELAGSLVGTPMYMEPSILQNFMANKRRVVEGFYDRKVDVWSLGIVAYELLIGIVPFLANDIKGLFLCVKKRDFHIPREDKRNFFLSKRAILFIDKTLNIDINVRPLPEELIEDPWFYSDNESKDKMYKMISDKEIAKIEKKTDFRNFWKPLESKKVPQLKLVDISYFDPKQKQNIFASNSNKKFHFKLEKLKMMTIKRNEHNTLNNTFSTDNGAKIKSKTEYLEYNIEPSTSKNDENTISKYSSRCPNTEYSNNSLNNSFFKNKKMVKHLRKKISDQTVSSFNQLNKHHKEKSLNYSMRSNNNNSSNTKHSSTLSENNFSAIKVKKIAFKYPKFNKKLLLNLEKNKNYSNLEMIHKIKLNMIKDN